MNTERHQITVSGIRVEVVRKAIKNLHLGVYPPHGRVRVAAPLAVSNDAVRLAVIGKLAWIKRQRQGFTHQPRQSEREMVSGESHYVLGQRFRLRVVTTDGPARVRLIGKSVLELQAPRGSTTAQREDVLQRWYRDLLRTKIPALVDKWCAILRVDAPAWGIKKMKTKWGSCNPDTGRIWINLELAKKPPQCLEYLMVHELVHLIERTHNPRFVEILDQHLPSWRRRRAELNAAPLAHEDWEY